jgi:hypothetical protein
MDYRAGQTYSMMSVVQIIRHLEVDQFDKNDDKIQFDDRVS